MKHVVKGFIKQEFADKGESRIVSFLFKNSWSRIIFSNEKYLQLTPL